MTNYTKKLSGNLDFSGTLYQQLEEFEPESRLKINRSIINFIDYCNKSRLSLINSINNKNVKVQKVTPLNTCIILGEWGLGKTTIFDVIIKDEVRRINSFIPKISANQIANTYRKYEEKLKKITINADKFLFVLLKLLSGIRDYKEIIKDNEVEDVEKFIETNLDYIYKNHNYSILFIFIDELEDLIEEDPKLDYISKILKGVKSLINGDSNIVKGDNQFGGFINLFLSCTSSAYYGLKKNSKINKVLGGIKRRQYEIILEPFTSKESIEYLYKLMKLIYNNENSSDNEYFPFKAPIPSLNTISKISLNNAGHIKSNLSKIINYFETYNTSTKKQIDQADGILLVDAILDQKLSIDIQGNPIPCLNNKKFADYQVRLNKNELKLIKKLIGEIKPFGLKELQKQLNFKSTSDIEETIKEVNKKIRKIEDLNYTILDVKKFIKNFDLIDLKNLLKENGVGMKKVSEETIIFLSENTQIPQEIFYERFSYYAFEDQKIKRKFFFTLDNKVLNDFFPELQNTDKNKLISIFNEYLEEDSSYIINPRFIDLLIPSKLPIELDILEDKEQQMKIWREIPLNRFKLYREKIIKIFYVILEKNNFISKNITPEPGDNKYLGIFNNKNLDISKKSVINILIWREAGEIKQSTVDEIYSKYIEDFKNKRKFHLILLISDTPISNELKANKKFEIMNIYNIVLDQLLIDRMLFLNEIEEHSYEKDEKSWKDILEGIYLQEINFPDIIDNWKKDLKQKGEYIEDLDVSIIKHHSDLSDISKAYLIYLYDFQNSFEIKNINLRIPFEEIVPIGISPNFKCSIDLKPETIHERFNEFFIKNDFLRKENGRLKIFIPKVERNIYSYLKFFSDHEIEIEENELERFFIDTSATNIFQLIYMKNLENRGLIDGNTKVLKKDAMKEEAEENYKAVKNTIDSLKMRKNEIFFHIYSQKQRDERLVLLEEFEAVIKKLYNLDVDSIKNNSPKIPYDLEITKNSVLSTICEWFFLGDINTIYNKSVDFFNELSKSILNLNEKIQKEPRNIEKLIKTIFNIEINKLDQFNEIKRLINDTRKLTENLTLDYFNKEKLEQLKEKNKNEEKFSYDNINSKKKRSSEIQLKESYFFNLIIDYFMNQKESIDSRKEKYLDDFKNIIKSFQNDREKINRQISSIQGIVSENLAFSTIKEKIITLLMKDEKYEIDKFNKLDDILKFFKERGKTLSGKINTLQRISKKMADIKKNEESYRIRSEKFNSIIKKFKTIENKEILSIIEQKVGDFKSIKEFDFDSFNKKESNDLNDLIDSITLYKSKLDEELKKFDQKKINSILKYPFKKIRKKLEEIENLFKKFNVPATYFKQIDLFKKYYSKLNLNEDFRENFDRLLMIHDRINKKYQEISKQKYTPKQRKILEKLLQVKKNKDYVDKDFILKQGESLGIRDDEINQIIELFIQKGILTKVFKIKKVGNEG